MINILNANIISEDDVTGQYHAFGPTPDPIGVMPAGCTVCSTSCMGNCSGDCTGGCGDANCEGQCSLTCESSCSADCTNTCMETCSGGCNLECVNGCRESCTSGCSGACQGCTGCSGSCIDACVNGCKHSCMNVNTTSGTHAIVPEWPSTGQIEDEDIAELLRVIKSYLDVLMQYDYKRISELDEAVVLHDADRFVGQIVVDGSPEDVGEINLADLNLVISDFDGRTVRITAASLVEFIRANYKNYWVWTPVIEEDEYGNKTTISWNFHSSFDETTPDPIYLADLVSGGIGTVTPEHPGLMPSELFIKLDGKDFIYFQALTGNNTTGEAAPAGTTLIRLAANFNGNTDAINVFNTELLGDLDARYAPAGTYVTEASLNQYKTFVSETYATNAAFTTYQTSVSETYETIANASATYATIVNFNALTNRVATTEANIATLNTNLSNIYTKTQADAKFVERGENARTQVPARVATVVGGTEGKAGLMLPGDIDSINSAIDTAQAASTAVTSLTSRVTANERAIEDLVVGQAYATTDYQEGTVTPGTVRIPVTSSVIVGENGAIDIKKYTVTNLIKNSTFVNGFATNWVSASNIDETISNVEMDSTLNVTVATLAFVPDGVISQSFYSDVRDGINVSITFKRHASADKIIEVKLDTETYVSHTITHGIGYYVAEFHFDVEDRNYLSSHTLYIHNPDTSNTVSYEIVNIVVQEGRKYTGWNTNPYDAVNNSVNIVTYSNQIKFQDLPEKYTEDVYDEDQVTLLHRAGDYIDPSSSVIMHKNSTYFFIHLTAANTVDGAIRNDAIPLRIDLDTGVCDISGNAVTAGTLRDTIDPSITLNVPVAQMNEFFAGTSTSFVRDLNMYNSTDTSVPIANRQWPKVELTFKRATSPSTSVDLATTPLVGAFDPNINKNGEIFNDYENNEATGDYSHASGHGTIATADNSTVIGKFNEADGTGANDPKHLFIIGNGTADNARSNIVEVSDDYFNLNGIFKQNGQTVDFSLLGDEIDELSDTEYAALVTKDPDKLYLVYESITDNRTIIVRNSNGEFVYSASIYGVVANGSPGTDKFATDSDAPTTPPTKVAPQLSGTALMFSYTTAEKTVYFQNFNRYSPNAGGRATDMDASNCYFTIGGTDNNQYSIVTAYDTMAGPFVALSAGDYVEYAKSPKPNGYLRIYKDNKLYATNEPPAASVVSYDNTNSGLTSTNTQDVIDEISTYLGNQTIEMPDTEYEALATKDPDKAYFVYEAIPNKRAVIAYDSNGDPLYRFELYGSVDNGTASWSNNVTTAPTIVPPTHFGTGGYAFKTTVYGDGGGTRYHYDNFVGVTLSNYEGNIIDSIGSNAFFSIPSGNASVNLMKGESTSWVDNIRLNDFTVARWEYDVEISNIKKIYKNNKLYATTELPVADNITYDNTNSGLTATTTQDAIDELKSISNIQYSTMPTSSADLVGEIVQFIGTTDSTYTHGCYYECVNESSVYSWKNVSTDILASANNNGLLSSTMYGTITNIPSTYLSQTDAASDYLSKSDASSTYLSKTDAASDYLSKSDASSTYLSKTDASSTYLSQTDAGTTYLSKSDASSTYLSKTDASSTYLTQTNAASTYVALADIGLASTSDIDAMFA